MRTLARVFLRPPYVLAGCAFALAPSSALATGVVSDFQDSSQISNWAFDNGPEYPGAQGSLAATTAYGSSCASLLYDFTPPTNGTGTFNPAYVEATSNVSTALATNATRLRIKFQLSNSLIHGRIRIHDTSGQTLQYTLVGAYPMTNSSTNSWMTAVINLNASSSHWGGSNDGVVHGPIKQIGVVLDATGQRNTGWMRFDDVELLGDVSAANVNLADLTLTAPGSSAGALADRMGVCIHSTSDNRTLDLIKNAGFRWIRNDLFWDATETTAGQYTFTSYDALVTAAESRNLHLLFVLDYGNPLYTGTASAPPITTSATTAYANFCQAAAAHFAGHDVAFEIWNEPDASLFWGGTPNADQYATVLRAGIDAVKRGNAGARVITGGLSATNTITYAYWDELQAQGALVGAGGLGAHLYGTTAPESRWNDIVLTRARLASALPGQDIWCTEWGYSSTSLSANTNGHDAVAQNLQAGKIAREMLVAWWGNLPLEMLYDMHDDGTNLAEPENNFGLINNDYTDKPAIIAARALFKIGNNHTIDGLLTGAALPSDAHVMRLSNTSEKIYIAWVEETAPTVTLQISDRNARVWDMFGKRYPLHTGASTQSITLSVSGGPIFIESPN